VGECHNLPSGTVHALGAGVLVAEVQTPSDTTYRVYDWGRTGRELHIAQAMECIAWGPAPAPVNLAQGQTLTTEFFRVSQQTLPPGATITLQKATVLMALEGAGVLMRLGSECIALPHGCTAFTPSGIEDGWSLVAGDRGLTVLLANVPVLTGARSV
jgi:mannose-6-phosphate isomerase